MIRAKYIIVASTTDSAGMNIIEPLLSHFVPTEIPVPDHWPEGTYRWYRSGDSILVTMDQPHYKAEFLTDSFIADHIIVASKHLSSAEQKAILVHPLGNWGTARHESGNNLQIAPVNPYEMTRMLKCLQAEYAKVPGSEYWVGVEATHHGPTSIDLPIMFVEVGGTETEWNDRDACAIAGRAILQFISQPHELAASTAILGAGGGHYAPAFIRRVDADFFLLGHIIPKFGLEHLTLDLLHQAWNSIKADDKLLLIDKSGTKSAQRTHLLNLAEELNIPYAMTSDYPTPKD